MYRASLKTRSLHQPHMQCRENEQNLTMKEVTTLLITLWKNSAPIPLPNVCRFLSLKSVPLTFFLNHLSFAFFFLHSHPTSFLYYIYLFLKKYATLLLPTISFYDMNAMGIGQMMLYLGINIADLLIFGSRCHFTLILFSCLNDESEVRKYQSLKGAVGATLWRDEAEYLRQAHLDPNINYNLQYLCLNTAPFAQCL